MDRGEASSRSSKRRQALGDGFSQANSLATTSHLCQTKDSTPTRKAHVPPHHESIPAHGALTVQNATNSPENKRLSAVTAEVQIDSKRSSQVSSTSTNATSGGKKRKTFIGPWRLGKDVGKGACGKVRLVKHYATGELAAAKIVAKKVAELSRAESLVELVESSKHVQKDETYRVIPFGIQRELAIMKLLNHPNIVRLKDVWENRSELYLIMEYVDGGELFDYVTESDGLPEDRAVWIFRQLLAAVLHCHRLGIHHRDLKPENILITTERDEATGNENPQIKLADFGMAALQPEGTMLTTPCGSIHYAAPEVFEKNYDGSKIDTWSLGVILYVMLTGNTPFAAGMKYVTEPKTENLSAWYNMIKRGQYTLENSVGLEAKDLIERMLNPDPQRRITLNAVWNHVLFRKWSKRWGESPESFAMSAWVGNELSLSAWNIWERKQIDREVLSNLRCLWHNEKEETMIFRLLSKERTQEKLFYRAILQFKEDSLEDYVGLPEGVAYSRSDYHHIRPKIDPIELPAIPASAFKRTTSGFSILNDDLIHARNNQRKVPPASVSSYDPYRSSRNPIVGGKDNYTSVTIHSRRRSTSQSLGRHGKHLRVDTVSKGQNRLSMVSSNQSFTRSVHSSRPGSARRSMSKASMRSSIRASNSRGVITIKPSAMHRRAVDFSRTRHNSAANNLNDSSIKQKKENSDSRLESSLKGYPHAKVKVESISSNASAPGSTPHVNALVRSRKEKHLDDKKSGNRKGETHSQVIDTEARKVSTELEKYCEEVFNRSSMGSSVRTAASRSQIPYETPSSSFSNGPENNICRQAPSRALPIPPSETPTTYMTRELAETRKRLFQRLSQDIQAQQNATYHEVLAQIDALLGSDSVKSTNSDNKRITSAPEPRSPEYMQQLPIISEESKANEFEGESMQRRKHGRVIRATTSPCKEASGLIQNQTIRMIDSPPRVAPLNIRKTSTTSGSNSYASKSTKNHGATSSRYYNTDPSPPRKLRRKASRSSTTSSQLKHSAQNFKPKPEANSVNESDAAGKKSWFKKRPSGDPLCQITPEVSRVVQISDYAARPRVPNFSDKTFRADRGARSTFETMEDFPITTSKKGAFLAFLSKHRGNVRLNATAKNVEYDGGSYNMALNLAEFGNKNSSTTAISNISGRTRALPLTKPGGPRDSRLSAASSNSDIYNCNQAKLGNRELGVERSLFKRLFNIKPETKILCFNAGRGLVRQELVRLLKGWRMYGIRDVHFDRVRNLVWARLAPENYLGIKPVGFVIQLFAMLEDDRRNKLCMIRFTQRNGAASSFRRVIETVENVMQTRALLVNDPEKKRGMTAKLEGE